jgi:DNA-binding transcriptional regulator YdaS (Cro superfamily)
MTLLDYMQDKDRRAALITALGTSYKTLWQVGARWRGRRCSPERAMDIERATGGAVTRASLRPDLWGDA